MTKLSFPRHLQRHPPLGSHSARHADPGHRGRAADPRVPRSRPRGGGFLRGRGADGPAGLQRALRRARTTRRPRPAAARRSTGSRVLRELHARRPELPVVIVSARSDLPTKLRGFDLGASDYLAKPFALDELIARLRVQLRAHAVRHDDNVLQRRHARRSTSPGARRGSASSSPISRTASSALLHHLVEHAGRGRQPRAPPRGGVGLPLRSAARTSSTSASAACARSSARRRRSRPSAMRATALAAA